MRFVYSLVILLYGFGIRIAAFFNTKAGQWIEGRKDWQEELQDKPFLKGCIWFHCASLGEFEQGRPLIEKIKVEYPDKQILLTFYSPSGYLIRKDYALANCVCYLPLDTKKNAKTFLDFVKPDVAIFVKYEIWHNFFAEIYARNIPLFIVSAIFNDSQIYFKPYGSWFRKTLMRTTKIFTQDHKSVQLLNCIGINQTALAGDTRFDRVLQIAKGIEDIPFLEEFCKDFIIVVAGSTWPRDEDLLMKYHKKHSNLKIIIAPHEIGESHINTILSKFPKSIKWSQKGSYTQNTKVLIIDTIGLLSTIYKYGDIAYVGGGFGSGIHNTLEPAVYGIPVIFGPNFKKFYEARELCAKNGAVHFDNYLQLESKLDELLNNDKLRREMGANAGNFVKENSGATQLILSDLKKTIG